MIILNKYIVKTTVPSDVIALLECLTAKLKYFFIVGQGIYLPYPQNSIAPLVHYKKWLCGIPCIKLPEALLHRCTLHAAKA